MPYLPQNPFSREDWLSELVRIDKDVKSSLKTSYNNYQTKYNPQSMTNLQKIFTFFTTHTITAFVTASFCLGGVATFAAQTTAPEAYKPSTVINNLFKNNKVQQNNSNTPLVADTNNDVASYDPCNISIKYPKQIAGEKILAVQPQDYNLPGDKSIPEYYGVSVMSQKSFKYDTSIKVKNIVSISCSSKAIPMLDNNLNSKMTIGELSELTGWFITSESKIEDIYTENQSTAGPYRNIYFKYNNMFYKIDFVTTKIPLSLIASQTTDVQESWNKTTDSPGIFGDQIQIQFNNAAKNVANTQVETIKAASSVISSNLVSSGPSQKNTITKENITLSEGVNGPKPDTSFMKRSGNDSYYFAYKFEDQFEPNNYDSSKQFLFSGEVVLEGDNNYGGKSYIVNKINKVEPIKKQVTNNIQPQTDSPVADPKNGSVLYAGGQKIYLNQQETDKLNANIPPLVSLPIEVIDMEITSVRFGGINTEGKDTFTGKDGNNYLIPKEFAKNLATSNYGDSFLFTGSLKSRIDDLGPLWYEATSGNLKPNTSLNKKSNQPTKVYGGEQKLMSNIALTDGFISLDEYNFQDKTNGDFYIFPSQYTNQIQNILKDPYAYGVFYGGNVKDGVPSPVGGIIYRVKDVNQLEPVLSGAPGVRY